MSQPIQDSFLVACPRCLRTFKPRGLRRHFVSCPASSHSQHTSQLDQSYDVLSDVLTTLQAARKRIPLVRVIPKQARSAFSVALAEVIDGLVESRDVGSWKRYLTFTYMALRVPPGVIQRRRRLHDVILGNLKEFKNGVSLETVLPRYPDKGARRQDQDNSIRLAAQKLEEGDVRGAVRLLASDSVIAENTSETMRLLKEKHPPPPGNLNLPPCPTPASDNDRIWVTTAQVKAALRSFPPATAGGIDGLRPRHLKDALSIGGGNDTRLHLSLAHFCEVSINGQIPEFARKVFYGAVLTPFKKLDGGVRPIACGLTLRRLATKIVLRQELRAINKALLPSQVGCAVKGGAEAAIHSVRQYVVEALNVQSCKVLVKLDFQNAFNTVRRDLFLNQVKSVTPKLYRLAYQAYGQPSWLVSPGGLLESATGVQQGDPAGPAFFCLALKGLTESFVSEIKPCYLDDCTLAGSAEQVLADIQRVLDFEACSGLSLNPSKCEMFCTSDIAEHRQEVVNKIRHLLPGIRLLNQDSLNLLGTPLLKAGFSKTAQEKLLLIRRLCKRVIDMHPQQALYLLRHALLAPKLTYFFRTTPAFEDSQILADFEDIFKETCRNVLNIPMEDRLWDKVTLPLEFGGMGIRSPTNVALLCYTSSIHATEELIQTLCPGYDDETTNHEQQSLRELVQATYPNVDFSECDWASQKDLDRVVSKNRFDTLFSSAATDEERACLLASTHTFSRRWLEALPSAKVGTLLIPTHFKFCASLRLRGKLSQRHMCVRCNGTADEYGVHALACSRSAGRHPRHGLLNQLISEGLRLAKIPNAREPDRLLTSTGKRPDGVTLVPYEHGKYVVWDATTWSTLCPSQLRNTAKTAGSAAEYADRRKKAIYREFEVDYKVVPLAFETHGPISAGTEEFLDDLGKKIRKETGNSRARPFFLQRLSIAVQRGNALAIFGGMEGFTGGSEDSVNSSCELEPG